MSCLEMLEIGGAAAVCGKSWGCAERCQAGGAANGGGSGRFLQTQAGERLFWGLCGAPEHPPEPTAACVAEGQAEYLEFIGQKLEAVKMNSREKAVFKILCLEVCLFVFFPSKHRQSVNDFQKAPGCCRERHSLFCCAGDTANPFTLRSGTSFLTPCF